MEFRILGTLEVLDGGRELAPRRAKQRALLALLLLHANEPVASEVLVEALWGERPPPTALTALHGHVSALRKLLGPERILTRPPGYLVMVRLVNSTQIGSRRWPRTRERSRTGRAVAADHRGVGAVAWRAAGGLPV